MSGERALPRVLYVVPHDFDAPGTGAMHRSRSLCMALAELAEVDTHIAWPQPPDMPAGDDLRHRLRRMLVRNAPYRPVRAHRQAIGAKLRGTAYDLVVVRYLRTWVALGMPHPDRLVVDFDDDPLEAYDITKLVGVKGPLRRLRRRLFRRRIAGKVDLARRHAAQIWVSNPDHCASAPACRLIPNAAPPIPARPGIAPVPMRFALFADLRYKPNIDGLDWYLRAVHPIVMAAAPETEVILCGHLPKRGQTVEAWRQPGVRVAGFVPDISTVYHGCAATIAPILSGSGTCVKVMESLAAGVPCIGTEMAYRGYADAIRARIPDLIATDAEGFAARMLSLGRAPGAQGALRARCGDFAARHWSQQAVVNSMRAALAGIGLPDPRRTPRESGAPTRVRGQWFRSRDKRG